MADAGVLGQEELCQLRQRGEAVELPEAVAVYAQRLVCVYVCEGELGQQSVFGGWSACWSR